MIIDEPRKNTGVPGLDEVLHGGLIARRTYLLVGAAGTGKTILALQWLLEGLRHSEGGLYITLAEPADEIRRNASAFGWNLDELDVLDVAPSGDANDAAAGDYSFFPPSEVEQAPVWQALYESIAAHQPQRVVIDSVTQLRYLSTDEYQFRKHILNLVSFLNRRGCTSLLAFEPAELEREAAVGLAVDGVLRMRFEVSLRQVVGWRTIEVAKLRGSDFMSGLHTLRITGGGMRVFPHHIEDVGETTPGTQVRSSGIAELDDLLGGGLESATTTIISGPTGVGKSTLCLSFLRAAAAHDRRALLYALEESPASLIGRCRAIGMPIDDLVARGALKIVRINPLKLYPDEFLALVREEIEGGQYDVVALDSLRGYQLAMDEFGSPVSHVHNLVTYLNRNGITTLLVNELEHITGDLLATGFGVSYMADNIILMRYAEHAGQIIKVIGCLKKRAGNFQAELRELRITSDGILVSEKLEHLRGVLTGVPSARTDEA